MGTALMVFGRPCGGWKGINMLYEKHHSWSHRMRSGQRPRRVRLMSRKCIEAEPATPLCLIEPFSENISNSIAQKHTRLPPKPNRPFMAPWPIRSIRRRIPASSPDLVSVLVKHIRHRHKRDGDTCANRSENPSYPTAVSDLQAKIVHV